MRITNVLFGLLLLLCVACDKSEKETPSGLKFKVVKAGDGVLPKPDEVVLFNYVFKDSKDSIWQNTYSQEFPAVILVADSAAIPSEDGMIQMLRMLSKGDSVTVEISVKDFFSKIAKRPIPSGVDSTLTFYYGVRMDSIMSRDGFDKFQENWYSMKFKQQTQKDVAIIDAYLLEKNLKAENTESGLRYVIASPGSGELAKSGQTVKVNYTGYTLEGKCFDSSIKAIAQENGVYNTMREPYSPYEVTIDESTVIMGWHEALKLLRKGSKATIYIPSPLAYGRQQRGDIIKENEILVFDMEVLEIK
jgi:FKBP-type peptidyl-prolyl cis-trans isomerase FkpA